MFHYPLIKFGLIRPYPLLHSRGMLFAKFNDPVIESMNAYINDLIKNITDEVKIQVLNTRIKRKP